MKTKMKFDFETWELLSQSNFSIQIPYKFFETWRKNLW